MSIKSLVLFSFSVTGFMMVSSCDIDDICIMGEGTPGQRTLNISEFNGIDLETSSNVTISQGTSQEVIAIGHQNIIDNVTTNVSNNIWTISLGQGCYQNFDLSFQITVPELNELNISSSGDILVNNFSGQSNLDIDISSSGDLTLNEFESLRTLNVDISSSGNFKANEDISSIESLNVDISSSGDYLAFKLSAENCTVDLSSSGNAELTATNTLDVTISGSGDVSYKGNPTITQDISSSGDLIDAN